MAEFEIDPAVKDRLALALDVDDLVAAIRIGRQMKDYFSVAKIGLELYSAAGPEAIGAIADLGYSIFLDVKLHDIPTTVGKAARVLGAFGVQYLTMHAHGGVDMLQAGVQGLEEGFGCHQRGLSHPMARNERTGKDEMEVPAVHAGLPGHHILRR